MFITEIKDKIILPVGLGTSTFPINFPEKLLFDSVTGLTLNPAWSNVMGKSIFVSRDWLISVRAKCLILVP